MKIVTWQKSTRDGIKDIAGATARISRQGMEAHARQQHRLAKYFPKEQFDLTAETEVWVGLLVSFLMCRVRLLV